MTYDVFVWTKFKMHQICFQLYLREWITSQRKYLIHKYNIQISIKLLKRLQSYFEIILLQKVESLTFSNMKLPEHWKRDWKATFLYKFRIMSMILVTYHKIKVHWFVIWNHPMIHLWFLFFVFEPKIAKVMALNVTLNLYFILSLIKFIDNCFQFSKMWSIYVTYMIFLERSFMHVFISFTENLANFKDKKSITYFFLFSVRKID